MFPFYTPWKNQKTRGFLTYSGVIEREHWLEIDQHIFSPRPSRSYITKITYIENYPSQKWRLWGFELFSINQKKYRSWGVRIFNFLKCCTSKFVSSFMSHHIKNTSESIESENTRNQKLGKLVQKVIRDINGKVSNHSRTSFMMHGQKIS